MDPRWATCDPDYTVSTDLFARCLEFFAKHYNFVSLEDVMAALAGRSGLPSRALLLTFDDGWSDNVEYAFPLLHARSIPGLLFIASDAVDAREPFFQEQLVGAWRSHKLDLPLLVEAILAAEPDSAVPTDTGSLGLRLAVRTIENMATTNREQLLASLRSLLKDDIRHMVTADQVRSLAVLGIAVGAHGKSHIPLTAVDDAGVELRESRDRIREILVSHPAPRSMSFPHGKYDASIVDAARRAGFEILFTSDPCLNVTRRAPSSLLGRIGIDTAMLTGEQGRFSAAKLAFILFRHPVLQLECKSANEATRS